jgi:lipopolysaccharide biosynthesis regulator YciM
VHDAATLAAEERVMRGLRYQAALADDDRGRAARLVLALAREDRAFTPAWVSAGDLFVDVGRRFTARRVWERGARYAPALALLERLERLNASEGKPERSARFYRRLARRHPDHPALPLMLARHLVARGELDEATAVLEHLPPAAASQPVVHALWADVHRRRGNHSLAAESYARALGADFGLVAPFACGRCGQTSDAWTGYCAKCRNWNTYRARGEETGAV